VQTEFLSGVAWTGLAVTAATTSATATTATLKAAARWNEVRLLTGSPDVGYGLAGVVLNEWPDARNTLAAVRKWSGKELLTDAQAVLSDVKPA
jgi:hypothetical protein